MKILFMCVANSARSQLAEAIARHLFAHKAEIQSAGSLPSKVNPHAVRVMDEMGIDLSAHHSKSIDKVPPDFLATLDYIITLCSEEVCPILLSQAKKLHWPMTDPAGKGDSEAEQLEHFRIAREELLKRLEAFGRETGLLDFW